MSHANAALTPRQRLRLARKVVEEGWSVAAAADYFRVSYPTAAKWAQADCRACGPEGMADRSSRRPHSHPNRTPQQVVKKIVHLRSKKRLGPVQIAGRLGMPASTVHAVLVRCRLNRLSHVDVKTGEPARRYEHDAPGSHDPRRREESSATSLMAAAGESWAGQRNREPAHRSGPARQVPATRAAAARVRAHRHRRPLPRRLCRDPRRRNRRHRNRGAPTRRLMVRRPRRHRRTSPLRQRLRLPISRVA